MKFTFGIITHKDSEEFINQIIDSIEKEKIPNYEIIIVGEFNNLREKCIVVPFDETIKRAWITRKKNIITNLAQYENIVYLHDYIKLEEGWYEGQLKAGNDFKIRMDKIINFNGERYRDFCIWPHNGNYMDNIIGRDALIPYYITHLSKYMYISGSYWVAKKSVMEEFPLNENLCWGEGEDVLWSKEVRNFHSFNMNTNSSVKIMKPDKDRVFNEANEGLIKKLREFKYL
jgi:hypothetical protein